jgi:hypothetical protein
MENVIGVLDNLAKDLNGRIDEIGILPDDSGFAMMSFPLSKDHWLYEDRYNIPPMPLRLGTEGEMTFSLNDDKDQHCWTKKEFANKIREAAKYAIRVSTMNGKDEDFDPDAMVQNFIVGLSGYWTSDGYSSFPEDNLKKETVNE